MVNLEDIEEGDTLVCVQGSGCCTRTGREYLIERDEDGDLAFKPSCWDDNGDWICVVNAELERFELRKRCGPW